ncbi:MAG TPA: 3-deoxy-D-manno-octulosonic acid transferase [Thiolapillus brandeum]|uniref:3-deoxy-D-manno-octulosonic acid transferase n=1 Tax=Thiolapillus brandeum TaxID=1076588 RepID=A0A7C5N397_9GAMM|nr:3-deoxy-D-manno-octulosonic acid transferase [Thiolapillus brandeum]
MRLYTLLLHLLLPFVVLRLYWRSLRAPDYRRRLAERFGFFRGRPPPGGIWVHAVSVGEVQAIEPLVRHLRERHPERVVILTTSTPTGSARVRALFGDEVFHVYFPYDLPWCVDAFLERVRPRLLVMVETEIWPNLLRLCAKRGIPTLLANGRLSARSARGYARLGDFTRRVFGLIGRVAAQSPADAERFVALGVPAERVAVTGSIKFDQRLLASVQEQVQVVKRIWGEDRPVWVAASTHEGEEEQVLEAHAHILERVPSALLVLVPRHPERFDRVAALVKRRGFGLVRRSEGAPCGPETRVFLGDTMGELPLFLGVADVAFIGGSLVKRGGHNMLEAAAQGVPVVFGPHVFNFSAIAALLVEREAAVQVRDARELAGVVGRWLGDASERSRIGENGRRAVEENRGALERLIALVEQQLP